MAPLVPTSHRLRRTDAPTLAVHAWGGDGPPTLLCHPTGFHGRVWAPVAERLLDAGRDRIEIGKTFLGKRQIGRAHV